MLEGMPNSAYNEYTIGDQQQSHIHIHRVFWVVLWVKWEEHLQNRRTLQTLTEEGIPNLQHIILQHLCDRKAGKDAFCRPHNLKRRILSKYLNTNDET